MLLESLHRLSSHRASCKQWSTALAVVVLLAGALGKLDANKLLWAAAPIGLLFLTEVGYAAQEGRIAEALKGRKPTDQLAALPPEVAGESVGRMAVAIFSVSIWPFYAGLGAIVAFGGGAMNKSGQGGVVPAGAIVAKAAGGCGSGGCSVGGKGCGTSGCGAAAGEACGCGGGASKTSAKASVPQQPRGQITAGARPLATVPPNAFGARTMPARPPVYAQPGQVAAPGEVVEPAPGGNAQHRPMVVLPPPTQNPQPAIAPPSTTDPVPAAPAASAVPTENAAPAPVPAPSANPAQGSLGVEVKKPAQ